MRVRQQQRGKGFNMGLLEKIKSYQSRKQLKAEIERLTAETMRLETMTRRLEYDITRERLNIQTLQVTMVADSRVPEERTKEVCMRKLEMNLEPYIEWDRRECWSPDGVDVEIRATLLVAYRQQ